LGVLENTSCALFADFQNRGHQDVIVVLSSGPLLFENDGAGKFRQKQNAFQFANPPQGTFTGAAVADYDRDGWLDIYFCLYAFYRGTGQYKYPSPYHDAENGPPNFLMRNNRDGTFSDVTAKSGLDRNNTRYSFGCGWNDYNADGWPDLYVVNDFGRKNLYRNNGDGSFTDVAAVSGTEDVGAGMSVSWMDFDNDGAPDLYVGNMWTAAGMRVSAQEDFKKNSSPETRALYQKHAMGNSLLRNRNGTFDDETQKSGVGIGRWAWSSDAFDFDHDGFSDLYCANGMISGPSTGDLNSFFWRQVVANSPDDASASHEYEQGWSAVNELIRSDGTWSGYERNVFYANNRDGTFSDVSGAVGLDFVEDGRAFALADFDHDGRLEIFLKNRNAPQLRVMKNMIETLPPSIVFRLKGTKSNRDAIGAAITVESGAGRQVRSLQAGSGFLSQHSKEVFLGLGQAKETVRASIHWPSGLVQEFPDLPVNNRIWIDEGSQTFHSEPFRAAKRLVAESPQPGDELPTKSATWLLAPVIAPDFILPDQSGKSRTLAPNRGQVTLLHFWTSESPDCRDDLRTFQANSSRWAANGLQLITINVDEILTNPAAASKPISEGPMAGNFSFPMLRGSEDVAAIYNILYRQLFDRHCDMGLPTSFLIDKEGEIVKVYRGTIDAAVVEQDARRIPRTVAERLARALPFPAEKHPLEFGRNYLSLGALYFQRGYLDQSAASFQEALRDDPSSAEALYGIGSVYLNQNKNGEARDAFERCVKLPANYPDTLPDAWNNLGVLATREGRTEESVEYFQRALEVNPRHVLSLDNLGNAYRVQKKWSEARRVLERALEISPEDPEANYSLGMVFAETNDTAAAREHLQRALKARPNYPEALNNLGVLALVTQHRDEAVISFEQCIQLAPAFDQAYLNLARVYALEGTRDKARNILLELLKRHPDHPQGKQMLEQLQN
jgi:tetratricopeptide (TPR) repeat protein